MIQRTRDGLSALVYLGGHFNPSRPEMALPIPADQKPAPIHPVSGRLEEKPEVCGGGEGGGRRRGGVRAGGEQDGEHNDEECFRDDDSVASGEVF